MKLHRFSLIALLAVAGGMCCTQVLGCDKNLEEDETGSKGTCTPGTNESCYSGPAGTQGVGRCRAGTRVCLAGMWEVCKGEVLPAPEVCNTAGEMLIDEDCDGALEEDCSCAPGEMTVCYSGAPGTENVGACKPGIATCNAMGTGFEPCQGEVVPVAETCTTPHDDDCNGQVNESGSGCSCVPNSTATCYGGPMGTENMGICKGGTQTCDAAGTGYGPCQGEVLPGTETCNTPDDDDCNGQVNEGGAGCLCMPNSTAPCYTGPGGTQNVGICKGGTWTCNAMGTAYGPCQGQVLPGTEMCNTPEDDDCDGLVNEEGTACGLRLYTRPFPQAGSYTSVLLKDVWLGPNAPPSTGIRAAELNATAVRLMVWADNGLYYERYNNVWQPPVLASSRFPNLNGHIVACALLGRFYLPSTDEMLILTTNASPPLSFTYRVPISGAPWYVSGPDPIVNEQMTDPLAPPQHITPLDWVAGEHRKPLPQDGDDWLVAWKGLGGITYEQWVGTTLTFIYKSKNPDATGPFVMNGVVPAPAAGTAVAAYYDAVLDTVSFVAP